MDGRRHFRLPLVACVLALAMSGFGGAGARADDPPPMEPPPEDPAPTDPGATPPPIPPEDDDGGLAASLDARVKQAIEKGVAWLKTRQRPDGGFGDLGTEVKTYTGTSLVYQYPLGPSALALYALLKCGVPANDEVVRRGFGWLKKAGKAGTAYEASVLLLAITSTADPYKKSSESRAAGDKVRLTGEWKTWALEVRDLLVSMRSPRGWRYWKNSDIPGGPEDVSSTQLALIALHQAEGCGVPVDPQVWADAIRFVLTLQEKDGPEADRAVVVRKPKPPSGKAAPSARPDGYAPSDPSSPAVKDRERGFHYSIHPTTHDDDRIVSGTRTACGVGSLVIAKYALETSAAKGAAKVAGGVNRAVVEQSIYDGLAWLAANWSAWANPKGYPMETYWLYCTERVMDLLRAARLGEHVWYAEMAESLLARQAEKGFWDTMNPTYGKRGPVIDTSLALLFLHRATRGHIPVPVLTPSEDGAPGESR